MTDYLIQLVLTTAIKFGAAWLVHKWPWLSDEARVILSELKDDKLDAKSKAISKIKECYGVGCPTDLKTEE